MADDIDGTLQENPQRGKLRILVVALTIIVAGGLIFVVLRYNGDSKPRAGSAGKPSKGTEKKSGSDSPNSKKVEIKGVAELSPFLVNLADKDSVFYLKATFQLGMAEEDQETIKSNVVMPAIRDAIISLLSSKTSDQILSTEGKNKLREEIRNRVNAVLPKGRVQEVYIVDFVVSQ